MDKYDNNILIVIIGLYLAMILANIKSVWFSGIYSGLWEPIAIWE